MTLRNPSASPSPSVPEDQSPTQRSKSEVKVRRLNESVQICMGFVGLYDNYSDSIQFLKMNEEAHIYMDATYMYCIYTYTL